MFDFETSVTGIEFKVRQLADEVARLRRLVSEKDGHCHELEEALNNSEKTVNNLKEENKLLKLGNKLSEKGESAEIKLKINQMIRAIDKSLDILKKGDGNSIGIG
jgi:predicted RNase H-like nuclease (RuvC/YqgF family)